MGIQIWSEKHPNASQYCIKEMTLEVLMEAENTFKD
jgi:hypothetical protein